MAVTATTPTNFRKNLASYLTSVIEDKNEVILTSGKKGNAIVISEDQWNSLNETLYILSSKKNREILFEGLENIKKGDGRSFSEEELDAFNRSLME